MRFQPPDPTLEKPWSCSISTSHNSIARGALAANGARGSITAFSGSSAILAFTRIRPVITPTLASVTINYTYDPLYQWMAANYSTGEVFTYTYDAVGNRLSDGAPAGVTTYTYNDANRIATVSTIMGPLV
jgi:YD repeat-containing protein